MSNRRQFAAMPASSGGSHYIAVPPHCSSASTSHERRPSNVDRTNHEEPQLAAGRSRHAQQVVPVSSLRDTTLDPMYLPPGPDEDGESLPPPQINAYPSSFVSVPHGYVHAGNPKYNTDNDQIARSTRTAPRNGETQVDVDHLPHREGHTELRFDSRPGWSLPEDSLLHHRTPEGEISETCHTNLFGRNLEENCSIVWCYMSHPDYRRWPVIEKDGAYMSADFRDVAEERVQQFFDWIKEWMPIESYYWKVLDSCINGYREGGSRWPTDAPEEQAACEIVVEVAERKWLELYSKQHPDGPTDCSPQITA